MLNFYCYGIIISVLISPQLFTFFASIFDFILAGVITWSFHSHIETLIKTKQLNLWIESLLRMIKVQSSISFTLTSPLVFITQSTLRRKGNTDIIPVVTNNYSDISFSLINSMTPHLDFLNTVHSRSA